MYRKMLCPLRKLRKFRRSKYSEMRPFDAQTAFPGLITRQTCTVKCPLHAESHGGSRWDECT